MVLCKLAKFELDLFDLLVQLTGLDPEAGELVLFALWLLHQVLIEHHDLRQLLVFLGHYLLKLLLIFLYCLL